MRDQYAHLRAQGAQLTAEQVNEALTLACDVVAERQLRHSSFLGVPPRPGTWIPSDHDLEEDPDPPPTYDRYRR